VRSTIAIQGAREHNLKNVSLEIPRDQLVVVTGVSGSGKSSLAFDTLYAEGQRRYMESLSSFARRFIEQVRKPQVDFMFGLSPVISIEQKTVGRSPRSTVGTLTDISSYLTLLFATAGTARCPYCEREVPVRTKAQIVEQLLSLPAGTVVALHAPVFPVYGEDLEFLFAEIRKKGCRRMVIDGRPIDISEEHDLEEESIRHMEAVVDRFVIRRGIDKQLTAGVENALLIGERFMRVVFPEGGGEGFSGSFGCPEHGLVMGDLTPEQLVFNKPLGACRTCLGLGTYLQVHPTLLIPDRSRSIAGGAFVPEAFRYNPDTWDGRIMFSLARHYGFSLDTPFRDLSPEAVEILFHGTHGEKFPLLVPEGAKVVDHKHLGQEFKFDGIINRIERTYRRYRQQQTAHSHMEDYLNKVMVEHRCPDCQGARLRPQRLLVTIAGKSIHEWGSINFSELREFLKSVEFGERGREAGRHILQEIAGRLDLLLGIGLDYLNFNRGSSTLSGGESQRIRLSTQIGSGLMGMLYVLDEPSIGLHPKDNEKMIETLRRLRDLGNTVIVVEHDEDTIRSADHVIEMGPGPGVHGGEVVAQGGLPEILACPASPTGQFLSGRRHIAVPEKRRPPNGKRLVVRGARENNLRGIDVEIPLGQFLCITGASGSGKSTLVSEILFKKLYSLFYDSRTLAGDHDGLEGVEHLSDVVNIDQSPIGRTPRSNPATYVGFYDNIRKLFAETEESVARGYTPSRFSFNVKGGRCEECAGDGTVTTHLHFMADVEVLCEACKGARYNAETLEITYRGKNIAEILDMSIEEGVSFFADLGPVRRKLEVLNNLGLGYLTLGQSATTLSGGEAQRIKLANELSKVKRGAQVLYILDEPTTGLHLADIERLLQCLNRLVELGHTVLVIEHHMDVIKCADWVIDLGPEGGHAGGEVIAEGTPEAIAAAPHSHTGRYLRHALGLDPHPLLITEANGCLVGQGASASVHPSSFTMRGSTPPMLPS
jgi:excinuclease ABC subunit A